MTLTNVRPLVDTNSLLAIESLFAKGACSWDVRSSEHHAAGRPGVGHQRDLLSIRIITLDAIEVRTDPG